MMTILNAFKKQAVILGLAAGALTMAGKAQAQKNELPYQGVTLHLGGGGQSSNSVFNQGGYMEIGADAEIYKNILTLSGGYQYYFKDPKRFNYKYSSISTGPGGTTSTVANGSFIPARSSIAIGAQTPFDSHFEAAAQFGLRNMWGGDINPGDCNYFYRAQATLNLFKKSNFVNLGVTVAYEHMQGNENLIRYGFYDKPDADNLSVSAALKLRLFNY